MGTSTDSFNTYDMPTYEHLYKPAPTQWWWCIIEKQNKNIYLLKEVKVDKVIINKVNKSHTVYFDSESAIEK